MKLKPAQRQEHAARRAELMRRIGRNAVVIVPAAHEVIRARDTHYRFRQNSDFAYLTGFPEPEAIAVIAPGCGEGEYTLFVQPKDKEREIWDGRRAGPAGARKDFGADQAWNLDEFDTRLPQLLAGREVLHYTLGEFPSLDGRIASLLRHLREVSRRGAAAPTTVVALETTLHEMRLFKRPAEIELMRRAGQVSAQAHVRAMRATRPGKFEWQIAAEIHAEFEAHDMQPGYGSIVGGGDNACILHYVENDAKLKQGDLLLIDAGGELSGYTADITRTFPVGGKFSAEQKAVYEVVLEAQKAALRQMRPGVSAGKPHEAATRTLTEGMVDLGLLKGSVDKLIAQDKHRQFYMHGTGHWLGMDVHDVGRYKLQGRYRPFEPGMVMTVEPGLYIAPGSKGVNKKFWGIGIRIEDDVLITKTGHEILTSDVPKSVREIESLMAG
ncbi:Xaa-Pro aminopeptidase [Panacagrimonas sp.]|uniref:Xaa-Pro aminopeptidase n=1 Tax=Panacagrimonas sp. TaxID=2480088 RepID=UPI003B51F60F